MDLEVKMLKDSGENVSLFTCELCDETFTLKNNLKHHVSKIHENKETLERFECKTCGKCFGKTEALMRHEDAVHLGLCKLKCHLP